MLSMLALPSSHTGTTYQLRVQTPDAGETSGPWPAVVFLDGDDQFQFALAAYDALRAQRRVRPLVLVGVGYGASYREPANRRARDYTPTRIDEEPGSGGADAFLSFLTETLWPELRRRWAVSDDVRGLAGHSIGSLFALHALFQTRPFFSHYLASAPSIWWDHRAILCRAQRLRSVQSNLPAHLYLSIGGKDSASMLLDLDLLQDQLTAQPYEGLKVIREDFPGRNHYDVLPDAFRAGLSCLFPGAESA